MGYEYQFKIRSKDLRNLSRGVDGIDSLEKLLSAAPGFIKKNGNSYSYSDQPQNDQKWLSTVDLTTDGFCLCLYQRSANSFDQKLMQFLMQELLNRCGRLEVENA